MQILEIIKKIISDDLKIPESEVSNDTEIGEIDGWDSLHNVQIFAAIEKQFSIKFSPEQIMDLENVNDIAELVEDLI